MSKKIWAGEELFDVDYIVTVLKDVLETPQARSIHIEFGADMDEVPIVRYSIERLVYSGEQEGG